MIQFDYHHEFAAQCLSSRRSPVRECLHVLPVLAWISSGFPRTCQRHAG